MFFMGKKIDYLFLSPLVETANFKMLC